MARDLAELQQQVIAQGYAYDFGGVRGLQLDLVAMDLRLVDSVSFDSGTDPGDDVTMYLIEVDGEKGYVILSDSFHVDPRKAALVDALIAKS
jgi:hypothetical protein